MRDETNEISLCKEYQLRRELPNELESCDIAAPILIQLQSQNQQENHIFCGHLWDLRDTVIFPKLYYYICISFLRLKIYLFIIIIEMAWCVTYSMRPVAKMSW